MGILFEGKVINLCTYKVVGMKRLAILFSIVLSWGIQAQDIHFSQFYMSPTNLNPALTGVMNCKMRFVANYRNQWAPVIGFANSFNTYNMSFDQKIPVGRYDYFGFGGTFGVIKRVHWISVPFNLNFLVPIVSGCQVLEPPPIIWFLVPKLA